MHCTAQPGLSSLKGWWWNGCLFFDDWKHHQLLSLAGGTFLAKASLPFSANSSGSGICLLIGFVRVRKCPQYCETYRDEIVRAFSAEELNSFQEHYTRVYKKLKNGKLLEESRDLEKESQKLEEDHRVLSEYATKILATKL
jgi:hypothetical protein